MASPIRSCCATWLAGMLLLSGLARAQSYDTPAFNFDRASDHAYVDSLLLTTKRRLIALNDLPKAARVDTARMELLLFTGTIHRSGMFHRDSSLSVARQVVGLAQRSQNVKYQIKGLMLAEIYHRSITCNYPEAVSINHQMLRLAALNPACFESYSRRIYRNLGKICSKINQFDEAIVYYTKAIDMLSKALISDPAQLADLHQAIAENYARQQKFVDAEAHYQQALSAIAANLEGGQTSTAFLLNDLGRLYLQTGKYDKAVTYLTKAATCWEQVNNKVPQAHSLADLARGYLALGKPYEAIGQAKRALDLHTAATSAQLTAYDVLAKAYESVADWKPAFHYQRLYLEKREEERKVLSRSEGVAIRASFERERLETLHQQETVLARQKYQTLQKQSEIDRLKSNHKTEALVRLVEQEKLEQQLEREALGSLNAGKQHAQQEIINKLKIRRLNEGLAAEERLRRQLYVGLGIISALGLLLLYYLLSVNRKNRQLRRKNREIEAALVKGQTIERRRVAAELHDRVSSLLGATKMTIQTLDSEALSSKNKLIYENSLHLLDDAARQVRQLSHNLIPDSLHESGLLAAIHELADKLNGANRTIFSVDYSALGSVQLPDEVAFNLYVICLELCTNVLRHGQATHATILLCGNSEGVQLKLTDDGIGLGAKTEAGAGLKNIRNRAQRLGGTFWIAPNAGQGTTAWVSVPVHRTPAAYA